MRFVPPSMVRAEPTDQSDEPQAKMARFVEQEVEEMPMREENEEHEDLSSEEEDNDEDMEPDTDFDFELSDDEEDVAIPMDAEDVVPVVDERGMADLYGHIQRNAINIVTNYAGSNASSRSAGTVLRQVGVDKVMTEVAQLWKQVDQVADEMRNIELWPYVFAAVQELWASGRMRPQNLGGAPLPQDFVTDYEGALEILLKEKLVPLPNNREEEIKREEYETRRVKLLQAKALKFHNNNENRPGWLHTYGALFPVQATYDLIAYLVFVFPHLGFDINENMETNEVWHPEYDEINPSGRRLMEICFIMDSSARQEFIELVQAKRRVLRELSPEELKTVTNLFDTMNSLFNWNFEYFLIDNAAHHKRRREIKQFFRNGQFEQHFQLCENMMEEAEQAYVQLQTMMGKH